MAKPKNNYYAVLSGRQPGIYKTWAECQRQVVGFKGARFKGFVTLAEAQSYMEGSEGTKAFDADSLKQGTVIFVDGSYRHGCYSWGFAAYQDGQLVFEDKGRGNSPEAARLRNVAGEMAGARQAVLWAEVQGEEAITICHDYEGSAAWPLKLWQAKLPETKAYAEFMSARLNMVRFQKVEGHTGVEGNERADQLAKAALEQI